MAQDSEFRIAIIGGGIGGLFCALSIYHHCSLAGAKINIQVFEQAPEYKEIGAGVGIGINAAKFIHKIGIGERLNAIAASAEGYWMSFRRFDDSSEVLTLPLDDNHAVRQAPCARTGLLDLFRETIEERGAATLHTRKACLRIEDLGRTAGVHFADNTSCEADLIIACDGIHSAVRGQFAIDKPMFSGMIAYRGVIPIEPIAAWPFPTWKVCWIAKHRHFLVFPINSNKELNIVAFVTKGEEEVANVKESWTSICDRKDVETDFAGFDKHVQNIISLMPDKPSKWRINDREPLDQWHYMDGKVVLLGDAAHAMTPHLGAGAGQSIEDGWILGRAISEYLSGGANRHFETLSSTTQLYQSVRLPRAQRTQAASKAAGNTYEMQTEDMKEKSFEECVPVIAERTRERTKRIWEEDLDAAYERMRDGTNGA